MFLRNYWYVAAMAGELGRDLLPRSVLDEPLVLFRRGDGSPVAMADTCPHRSLPLSKGELIGDRLRCAYHGLEFDGDGVCVRAPGQSAPPPGARVRTFPVVEKWRWIWIWMGDPERADANDIPDMHWNDDPDWIPVEDRLTINCHYQLLADNLIDLSHEAYVHRGTIGNDAVAETPATASVDGDTVVVERHMENCPAPPLYTKLRGYDGNIDRMHRIEFRPPANIVIESKSAPVGANDDSQAMRYWVLNAITPETETSTHHFWSVARDFAPEDEIQKLFYEGSLRTFNEDIEVLESQQEMIARRGEKIEWVNLGADAGCVYARRIVDRLLEQEAG